MSLPDKVRRMRMKIVGTLEEYEAMVKTSEDQPVTEVELELLKEEVTDIIDEALKV